MSRLLPPLSADEKAAFVAACRVLLTAGKKGGPVRFKHEGRSVKGIDCVGVPAWGMGQIGRHALIEDLEHYPRNPDGHTLRRSLVSHLGEPIRFSQAEGGDIALMRWFEKDGRQWVNHVGVITDYQFGGLGLLHSFIRKPYHRVIEHCIDPIWRNRIVEVFRT